MAFGIVPCSPSLTRGGDLGRHTMTTLTLAEFTKRLEAANTQKGAAGVAHMKALTLESCMIVDDYGNPVDPASLDVVVSPSAPADEKAAEPTTDEVAKSIRTAIRSELNSVRVSNPIIKSAGLPEFETRGRNPRYMKSKEGAYRFGQFVLASAGRKKSMDWCEANGVCKAHSEDVDSAGGSLVPEEFEAELITLREQYGVFRANARIFPMVRETLQIPRRQSGLTAYFTGEAASGTESTQSFDRVSLVAKKISVLTTVTNELLDDAIVNVGDQMAGEMAQAFAQKEDDCGFNGDGTSTYGGIVGLKNLLTASTVQYSDSGQSSASAVTAANVADFLGLLPHYAGASAKIYCSKKIYHTIFERLAYAAGGASATEYVNGVPMYKYQGIPVVISQVMTAANGDYVAYYGDLKLSSYFGDRAETRIAMSDSALNAFEQDEKVFRGTTRFDINNANVGSSTAAGAVVALVL